MCAKKVSFRRRRQATRTNMPGATPAWKRGEMFRTGRIWHVGLNADVPIRFVTSPSSQTMRKAMLRPSALWALKLANNCGNYGTAAVSIYSVALAALRGKFAIATHTRTHIQATRLMLPKTPDRAKGAGIVMPAVDMAACTTKEDMLESVVGEAVGIVASRRRSFFLGLLEGRLN